MAGKRRTSFMKMNRDRELAEKRERKREKRSAKKQAAAEPNAVGDAVEPPVDADATG